jgi:formylmethanofuran dehydrogenase subunit E
VDDRPTREQPGPLTFTPKPGELPSDQLRRVKSEQPRRAVHIKYLPHSGMKQRLRGLKQLAKSRKTEVVHCSRCNDLGLLDDLQDDAAGKLCCLKCLTAETIDS